MPDVTARSSRWQRFDLGAIPPQGAQPLLSIPAKPDILVDLTFRHVFTTRIVSVASNVSGTYQVDSDAGLWVSLEVEAQGA